MSAYIVARPAVTSPWGKRTVSCICRIAAVLGLAALAGACSVAASREVAPRHPADPSIRVPAASYRSVTRGYASQRPAGPLDWRERNERVAPQGKE